MSAENVMGEVTLTPEPIEFRTRPPAAAARLLAGATTFFFAAWLFAYVYLRSLDTNKGWTIGAVNPSGGLGVGIVSLLIFSGIFWYAGSRRPTDTVSTGAMAIVLAVIAVILQFVQYTTLGFGPSSGAFASVFIGWTITYALGAIGCIYWMEVQLATIVRSRKHGVDADEYAIQRSGVEACAFYWSFYVAVGILMFVVLYII